MLYQGKKSVFLKAVRREVNRLKELGTFEEKSNLNSVKFEPYSPCDCIYGQMTGDHNSERANQLHKKTLSTRTCLLNGITLPLFKRFFKAVDKYRYTPLEIYLMMPESQQYHNHIIFFIKGEVETLNISL